MSQDSLDEQIAAAMIAKMAGSTLLQVDTNTTHHSNQGPATRIDPKSFLTSIHQRQQDQRRQQVEQLHDMAEKMYPLPAPIEPLPPIPSPPEINIETNSETLEILKSIDSSLKELLSFFKQTK